VTVHVTGVTLSQGCRTLQTCHVMPLTPSAVSRLMGFTRYVAEVASLWHVQGWGQLQGPLVWQG
jgi:hypothetical protein